jgi:hypothetical protein
MAIYMLKGFHSVHPTPIHFLLAPVLASLLYTTDHIFPWGLPSYLEDGDRRFLQKFYKYLSDYTTPHIRRQYSSAIQAFTAHIK